MTTYRLMPYTVEATDNIENKIPPGVSMIKAPEVVIKVKAS
ncbi:hypothetical protein [Bacillus cereus]|nr:hypothetical protein [Bacillus cereus]